MIEWISTNNEISGWEEGANGEVGKLHYRMAVRVVPAQSAVVWSVELWSPPFSWLQFVPAGGVKDYFRGKRLRRWCGQRGRRGKCWRRG